jgi:hypothetical protein
MQREAHARRASDGSPSSVRKRAAQQRRAELRLAKDRPRVRATHNEAARAGKNSAYELEGPTLAASRPSRKSTRRSPTHIKTDSALRITTMNRNASPQARSQRRGGKTT